VRINRFIVGLVLLLWFTGCYREISSERTRIIEVASALAEQEGFNPQEMNVLYDEGNTKWDEVRTLIEKSSGKNETAFSVLDGKNYQAVRFAPRREMLGGVLWVFVDRDNLQVISFFGEE